MIKTKSSIQIIDYRNAKYQGPTNQQKIKQGFGVLIDDDLSFYASQWVKDMLSGLTLVYISHGKYIYGEWERNQPHGLNVFRSGDTVLVGEFNNGQLIGRILVIFEKFNIISVLETKENLQKFEVIQCGKLFNHQQLVKYVNMLDVDMPQHFFSLIKFVTYLHGSEQNQQQQIITTPCKNGNCYFGFMKGLAITFNSNNGVVSVGYHENKQITGYGGKFDGKSIEQGNFQFEQTITYNKKRPNNQIYAIFQKMHKRSLNFKNHYFDSKVKTLGNIQTLLRGNIQKIVNYNMKNKIDSTTVNQLNDSLDYQNIDDYQSVKTIQNRVNMYENEKQTPFSRKNHQEFKINILKDKQKEDIKVSQPNSRTNQTYKPEKSNISNPLPNNHMYLENNKKQNDTVRKSQIKTSAETNNIYYAKKSPIRYKEQYGKKFKDSEDSQKQLQEESTSKSVTRQFQRNKSRSPMNIQKVSERKIAFNKIQNMKPQYQRFSQLKIPKFGGLQLQIQELSTPKRQQYHQIRVQKDIVNYKIQLQKSRSNEKEAGRSISKVLKRPNYEDIEQRRERLLNQFKGLNKKSENTSRVSNKSQQNTGSRNHSPLRPLGKGLNQQISIQVIQYDYNGKNSVNSSPCVKQKFNITSSQSVGQSSTQGYMPLSLLNEKSKHKDSSDYKRQKHNIGSFVKKQSIIQRIANKQNTTYMTGSFSKFKQNKYAQGRENNYIRTIAPTNEEIKEKVDVALHSYNRNRTTIQTPRQKRIRLAEENRFSEIQLRTQQKQQQLKPQEYTNYRIKRDISPISSSNIDISNRRKSYKYYFE